MTAAPSTARVRGPLRLAVAILLLGVVVIWLVKPIGDPCPDLGRLPQGSTASSSPSFSPPLTRTCTYLTGGIEARSSYVPWLDWIVLVLVAGLAAAVASFASRAGRRLRAGGEERAPGALRRERVPRARNTPRQPRAERVERQPRTERVERQPRAERAELQTRAEREPRPSRPARDRPVGGARTEPGERDAAERARARRERADRARDRRER